MQSAVSTGSAKAEPAEASRAINPSNKPPRKRNRKIKPCQKHLRQFLGSVTVDGNSFTVGDSAYVSMTEDFDEDDFIEVEACQLCGSTEPEDVPMLECNGCLLGYHIACLTPPLSAVPKVTSAKCEYMISHACKGWIVGFSIDTVGNMSHCFLLLVCGSLFLHCCCRV